MTSIYTTVSLEDVDGTNKERSEEDKICLSRVVRLNKVTKMETVLDPLANAYIATGILKYIYVFLTVCCERKIDSGV